MKAVTEAAAEEEEVTFVHYSQSSCNSMRKVQINQSEHRTEPPLIKEIRPSN
jgi:hypothetical protein